ncbi:hypothetical protein ACQP3F_31850, partial [Escherichia coli]
SQSSTSYQACECLQVSNLNFLTLCHLFKSISHLWLQMCFGRLSRGVDKMEGFQIPLQNWQILTAAPEMGTET